MERRRVTDPPNPCLTQSTLNLAVRFALFRPSKAKILLFRASPARPTEPRRRRLSPPCPPSVRPSVHPSIRCSPQHLFPGLSLRRPTEPPSSRPSLSSVGPPMPFLSFQLLTHPPPTTALPSLHHPPLTFGFQRSRACAPPTHGRGSFLAYYEPSLRSPRYCSAPARVSIVDAVPFPPSCAQAMCAPAPSFGGPERSVAVSARARTSNWKRHSGEMKGRRREGRADGRGAGKGGEEMESAMGEAEC